MFTGLVAGIGRLARIRPRANALTITVQHKLQGGGLEAGESIAVDGCCLTVVSFVEQAFDADLSPETLGRSGGRARWKSGRAVNLERALCLGDRLGGHLVQGHVDALSRLTRVERLADGSTQMRFTIPEGGQSFLVLKGSVALDGVSLTLSRRDARSFEVTVIPSTLAATTLSSRRVGDDLTLEYDVLGKYAVAAMEPFRPS